MSRDELLRLLLLHKVHATWCYHCNKHVGTQAEHYVDLLMPTDVDYILEGRVLND